MSFCGKRQNTRGRQTIRRVARSGPHSSIGLTRCGSTQKGREEKTRKPYRWRLQRPGWGWVGRSLIDVALGFLFHGDERGLLLVRGVVLGQDAQQRAQFQPPLVGRQAVPTNGKTLSVTPHLRGFASRGVNYPQRSIFNISRNHLSVDWEQMSSNKLFASLARVKYLLELATLKKKNFKQIHSYRLPLDLF